MCVRACVRTRAPMLFFRLTFFYYIFSLTPPEKKILAPPESMCIHTLVHWGQTQFTFLV